MRFFTVEHQVCDFDLSVSSAQLKTMSWPGLLDIKCFRCHFLCWLLLLLVCPPLHGVGRQNDHGRLQKEFVRMSLIAT